MKKRLARAVTILAALEQEKVSGRSRPPLPADPAATAKDEKAVVVHAREDGRHLAGARARVRGDVLVGGGDGYGRAGG
ncbi:hypothetical protein ZWY2020_019950 [Hordeum vulgare]|nr:hypothetical protein ZWY2020_019950 [Hordeum vulgare]